MVLPALRLYLFSLANVDSGAGGRFSVAAYFVCCPPWNGPDKRFSGWGTTPRVVLLQEKVLLRMRSTEVLPRLCSRRVTALSAVVLKGLVAAPWIRSVYGEGPLR